MVTRRAAGERGRTVLDWLDSRHTFSFNNYHDPRHMGFGPLRVINEDFVRPGAGFPAHGHRNMEILSYVIAGGLEHRDSLGHGSRVRPGEIQMMRAGTGIRHSEHNASLSDPLHFLQIWIEPDTVSLTPAYDQRTIARERATEGLLPLAGPEGDPSVLGLRQDARLLLGLLPPGAARSHALGVGRRAWVQMVQGTVEVDGVTLTTGDGAALTEVARIDLTAREPSEVLLFDLP